MLQLKQKQSMQLNAKLTEHGISDFPIPTSAVDQAYDDCRKVLLEHLQLQVSIDQRKNEIAALTKQKQQAAKR